MSLSMAEIEALVAALQPRLEGGRIERIDQPDPHGLVLSVRAEGGLYRLLLCAHPRFSRLHLLATRPEQANPAAGFCNAVRQHMTGAPIQALRQEPRDRIVTIESMERDAMMRPHGVRLVAELVGPGSNLILVGEDGRILAALHREDSDRRTIAPGAEYAPLPTPADLPQKALENRFARLEPGEDPLALSRAVQVHYATLEAEERTGTERARLSGALRTALKRARRKGRRIDAELERARNAEEIRRKGELLKLALHDLQAGQREVVVPDLFDSQRPEVRIELDPTLSPQENLERVFARYKRAKAALPRLERRSAETQRRIQALADLEGRVDTASELNELERLESEARRHGVSLGGGRPAGRARELPRGPRTFRSAEGLEILVARSQAQNVRLTFGMARGDDRWMHVLGWPGPHVIIRKAPGKSISAETLLDAAHLAVHFSKIRGAEHAEVVHTPRRYVRRRRGAPPGQVSYARADTMRIDVDRGRLERLLSSPESGGQEGT